MADNKIISLEHVYFTKNKRNILNDISWEIQKGEHWAILGLNGSGKTTLLSMLTAYLWKSSGEIYVLGNRFGQTNVQELRKSIGFVSASIDDRFQARPNDTPLEIVLSGKSGSVGLYDEVSNEDIKRAERFLEKFKISHLISQPFYTLSQGERKRVFLARAWMAEPEIIILDEPCSGLDLYSREQLLCTIQNLANNPDGPTLIYVSHHIEEIIPAMSHALLIKNGQIVKAGIKRQVLTEENLTEAFQLPLEIQWQDERPWVKVRM